jgi:peptide deformylase
MEQPNVIKITDQGIIPVQKLDLVASNDPILLEIIPEFNFFQVNGIDVGNQMVEGLKLHSGLGLAAPQIGLRHRVFAMGLDEEIVAFFNPKILEESKETILLEEGCLSFPGLFPKIRRADWVDVEYQDFNGLKHETHFNGITARVFQHELDHLNGIVFTKRAGPLALQMAKKRQKKLQTRIKKVENKIQTSEPPKIEPLIPWYSTVNKE